MLGVKDERERAIYRFLMSQGRGIREGALHRTSHSPSFWWLQRAETGKGKRKKRRLLSQSFAFVHFAFAPSIPSFTQLNCVDLRAAGIPETMIKEWESRDEERVRDIWWRRRKKKKEKEERKQSERARWETSRKLPTMPLLPPSVSGAISQR